MLGIVSPIYQDIITTTWKASASNSPMVVAAATATTFKRLRNATVYVVLEVVWLHLLCASHSRTFRKHQLHHQHHALFDCHKKNIWVLFSCVSHAKISQVIRGIIRIMHHLIATQKVSCSNLFCVSHANIFPQIILGIIRIIIV